MNLRLQATVFKRQAIRLQMHMGQAPFQAFRLYVFPNPQHQDREDDAANFGPLAKTLDISLADHNRSRMRILALRARGFASSSAGLATMTLRWISLPHGFWPQTQA